MYFHPEDTRKLRFIHCYNFSLCIQPRQHQVSFPYNLSYAARSAYTSPKAEELLNALVRLPRSSLGHLSHHAQDGRVWEQAHNCSHHDPSAAVHPQPAQEGATAVCCIARMPASYQMNYAFGIAQVSIFVVLRWPCAAGGLDSIFFSKQKT